jgi:hypothetical protein
VLNYIPPCVCFAVTRIVVHSLERDKYKSCELAVVNLCKSGKPMLHREPPHVKSWRTILNILTQIYGCFKISSIELYSISFCPVAKSHVSLSVLAMFTVASLITCFPVISTFEFDQFS